MATDARGLHDTEHTPFGISVVEIEGGRIVDIVAFHDPGLFPAFDLPAALPPAR